MITRIALASAVLLATTAIALADSFPLPDPHTSTPLADEDAAPFIFSEGLTLNKVTDVNDSIAKGVPASKAAGVLGIWDMVAFSPDGKYLFIPSEESTGGGLLRYHFGTGDFATLAAGDDSGDRDLFPPLSNRGGDLSRIDPATYTPHDTVIFGEETVGGRLLEARKPFAQNNNYQVRWLDCVPAVAHEGLRFDSDGNLYFVDENSSGSVYRYSPARPKDLARGATSVLKVAFGAKTGAATWVPITDSQCRKLTTTDPFVFGNDNTGGRNAADEVGGTAYNRPEDLHFFQLANGNEAFLFSETGESAIYTVELLPSGAADVRIFADQSTINLATGAPVGGGNAGLESPDNVAVDTAGNKYIVEDQQYDSVGDPTSAGDIWKACDVDNDGVAESIGRWMSLGVQGAEPSGLEQDPTDPDSMVVVVQHPSSKNDALWRINGITSIDGCEE